MQSYVSKAICGWMIVVIISMASLSGYMDDTQRKFYRFGPGPNLKVLGLTIDSAGRYIGVVSYSFINSAFRTLHHNVLQPWLVNTIQDDTRHKPKHIHRLAFEITTIATIYQWFDWFIYMNMLLAQIDMVVVEVVADLIMSICTTAYYLQKQPCLEGEDKTLMTSA